jgi:alkylated DNA repair dioxygenase AlkB
VPNQCLVNEYIANQGISCHVEDPRAFGEVISSLSLSGSCYMTMRSCPELGDQKETRIFLERRSLLILSEDARYKWKHGITCTRILPDPSLGCTFKRGKNYRRVSLTFRKVLEEGTKKPEKPMKDYIL